MLDVPFFFLGNLRKCPAEAARSRLADACVTGHREGLEHDLLNDETGSEVALGYAAHKCFANALPVLRVDVVRNIHANLAAFSSESGSMSLFALCVFEGI